MALTGLAIAAALGLAKDQLVDQPAADRKRKLAASTQRLSPWTGNKAEPVNEPNTAGTMLQYGAMGAQMGAGYDQNKADVALKKAQADRLNSGGSLYGGFGGGYGKDLTSKTSNPWSGGGSDDPDDFWSSNKFSGN